MHEAIKEMHLKSLPFVNFRMIGVVSPNPGTSRNAHGLNECKGEIGYLICVHQVTW